MAYDAVVYRVMIASPSDVASERSVIRDVLAEWNSVNSATRSIVLLPAAWETDTSPEMGDRPQSIINRQIVKECDLLVGVFWTRIGTATGQYPSGTVEEIEEHIKAGRPVMLYFSRVPVLPDSVDQDQYSQLKEFRRSCEERGLFETYDNLSDFQSKFYRQLQIKINKDPYFRRERQPVEIGADENHVMTPAIPGLSKEAQTLLKEASRDRMGNIIHLRPIGGLRIQTNNKQFVENNNPRTRAIWEAAIEELEREDLIADRGYKREVFALTRRGYEVAEIINP